MPSASSSVRGRHFCGHEGLRLRLLDDLHSQQSFMLLGLLRRLVCLLLLLLWLLHGYVKISLRCLLPEKVVDLEVGLGDHLRCPRPVSLVASRGLLLGGGAVQGGLVPSSEVGQLHC